jgi:Ca2+/Na+ antiporter
MDKNLMGGFIMAAIGTIIGIIGATLYCIFGIGFASTVTPTEEGPAKSNEARMAVDGEGNPTGEIEGNVTEA